jgi:ppGpp synthetase/RelA/SpoT-type nucleotidyltranferase
MAFSSVPKESKNQINKAGLILIKDNISVEEWAWAIDLADKWRACHAYPINTFQSTLRVKLRDYSHNPIVAQRLKRMPTIIDKLKRYPSMKLTTMNDIGGVRAVLGSVSDVYRLADSYRNNPRFSHELFDEYDYIKYPRSEDGYRSFHLIYKYINTLHPEHDGLRIEMQIRTKLQHIWATAVETMSTFLGQALKSRKGEQEWLDFFALTSSAFAYKEKRSLVPRFGNLKQDDTHKALAESERKLSAIEKMNGFSVAADAIIANRNSGYASFYHLIVLNSLEKKVQVTPYGRNSFEQALEDYSKVEKEVADGKKLEPVLVSAGRIGALRRAYPNFFLDITEFVGVVSSILNSVKE